MRLTFLALALALAAQSARAEDITLPSGLVVSPLDILLEEQADGSTLLTLRYVSPRIDRVSGDLGYDDVAGDLDQLCDTEGLMTADEAGGVDEIVVTLMDRPVERGSPDPDATMFIGSYLPVEGTCQWQ